MGLCCVAEVSQRIVPGPETLLEGSCDIVSKILDMSVGAGKQISYPPLFASIQHRLLPKGQAYGTSMGRSSHAINLHTSLPWDQV